MVKLQFCCKRYVTEIPPIRQGDSLSYTRTTITVARLQRLEYRSFSDELRWSARGSRYFRRVCRSQAASLVVGFAIFSGWPLDDFTRGQKPSGSASCRPQQNSRMSFCRSMRILSTEIVGLFFCPTNLDPIMLSTRCMLIG
jgi:hypothetical protein